MEESRNILILTDGKESPQGIADRIAASGALDGCSVATLKADAFYGTDILPAGAFFLGCEAPSPLSFTYIETLFERINLSGRRCGVFSASPKALRYLSGILRDCGASQARPFLAKGGKPDDARLRDWVKSVLGGGKKR